jgi:NitT/TauT family transport system ATP-binding protein
MSYISINNVWKEYAGNVVLERLNLKVNEGEFCTIVGASGCGKTTFLRMLLGEEAPTRGEILLNGKVLPVEPSSERGIVFQRYSVFPHLSVLQNVMLSFDFEYGGALARVFGQRRREAVHTARTMLDSVGLGAACDKFPSALSGGMQQRLAIAQALVKRPRILLLDEPFGALDPGIRADMHTLILNLWRELGITIFMITHDLREGFHLGSRLLVFDKVRHDPQAPQNFGARITYDLKTGERASGLYQQINDQVTTAARNLEQQATGSIF